MKIIIGIIFGFALGFFAHLIFSGQSTTKHHWQVVERYNAFVRDPANYKPDAATGFSVASPPSNLESSLAALVEVGELEHVDLILPTVPHNREAGRYWMKFCETNKEIVYATGNHSYVAFTPAGTQPFHMNVWFRHADSAVVQRLIRDLEETYKK